MMRNWLWNKRDDVWTYVGWIFAICFMLAFVLFAFSLADISDTEGFQQFMDACQSYEISANSCMEGWIAK